MRPVVLYALLSLDGVAESPDQFVFDWDDPLDANLADVIDEQDAVLLGRQMYDEWSQHWPTSDMEPFAPFINRVQKYVFGNRVTRDWAQTSVVQQPAEQFVASLKQTEGKAIGLHGSIALSRSLLRADLVDELRLAVFPATIGSGRRLFDETGLQRWQLTASDATPSGALVLHYRRRTD
ncbi:MAG TPA: dihydrofolate reductase family protein [Microlunatus sp.]|jgi:dihydrofolate reductase|nr:dihydrofolate reductase family protein [Microlunatus sp.]